MPGPGSFDTDSAILQIVPAFYYVAGRIVSYTPLSFTNQSFQISIDLQEPLSVTLKNFVKSNWPPTSMLDKSKIKFGNKWYNGYGSFHIHFRESNIPEIPISIGWQYSHVSDFIEIHFWAQKNNMSIIPQELDDMKRSVAYIIQTNMTQFPITMPLGSSISVIREETFQEQQPMASLWHAVMIVEVSYWKATSN
jgi:hypothetical protein